MNARIFTSLACSLALTSIPLLGGGCSLSLSLDPQQGQNAAVAGGTTTESSTATLVRLTESDDPQVRAVAVRGLAELGTDARSAAPSLHRLVDDPDPHVRYESAKALAAVNPEDPALPAMLLSIAKDERTPEEQRAEMQALLDRPRPVPTASSSAAREGEASGPIHREEPAYREGPIFRDGRPERVEPAAPTTRPTREVETEVEMAVAASPPPADATPTTRPIMASERSEQINESTRVGADDPVRPATRPATRPAAKNHWGDIPGLSGIVDPSADDTPPIPDINLFGYKSYTSSGAVEVKDWIQRRASLTDQEKQARVKEFQDWRYGQDKLIYQKVLER